MATEPCQNRRSQRAATKTSQFSSVAQSCPTLQPHRLQHTSLPCPSPTPRACSNSCHLVSDAANHLVLCCPLLLLPSIFPSIRVFPNESVLRIRWPKYWNVSFTISPSNEYSRLISFRMDWFDLLAVQRNLKSLLQHHSSKASFLRCSAFFIVQPSHLPGAGAPPVAKVMRKEAWHTQRWDRASGVPLEILEHLPPKPESAYFLLCALTYTSLTLRGAVPHHLSLKKELTYSSS